MELLVLGGTSFAGRHVVEAALAADHTVTTFNRGRTNPGLFPDVRILHGDRASGDYAALVGAGPFDAVVDMCAYVPRAVREAIGALGSDGLNGPYTLISSVSAYAEPQAPVDVEGFTEESPLAALPDGIDAASEEVTGETYGPLKALTEQATSRLCCRPRPATLMSSGFRGRSWSRKGFSPGPISPPGCRLRWPHCCWLMDRRLRRPGSHPG